MVPPAEILDDTSVVINGTSAVCESRNLSDIVEWISHQVRHRIIGLGVRISKLLSDVRPALNFLPSHAIVPTIADAFMLGSAATVNNDFDARKFKVAPFAGNPNDYQRFVRDAMDYLGSCFGNHQDEEYSLGDEAEGKSPYGYIEQDPLDTSFFFSGMAAALPLPGAAAPAGGHPPGTPPNAQRVALLSRANRRKKTLAAFLTAHVTDQNLKTMLQNQAAGDGGRMWQLLRQHCYRPINDLTMHDLKDKISSLSFDSVEIGRSADSLNRLVQVLNNLNHQLPAANRFTESEMVEKVLRCISSLGNTPLAHDARQELAADVTERRFWLPANAWYGGAPVASCARVLRLGAQSSYESESFAYAGASMSLRFCQQVAVFGGGGFKMPTTIRTDSNGVVLATRNGGVTSRNRHFEKFLRLGRLHYEDNISSPEFVPTSDQCADIWTKALDKTTFLKHRAKLVR